MLSISLAAQVQKELSTLSHDGSHIMSTVTARTLAPCQDYFSRLVQRMAKEARMAQTANEKRQGTSFFGDCRAVSLLSAAVSLCSAVLNGQGLGACQG